MKVIFLQSWSHLTGSSEDKNLEILIMHIFLVKHSLVCDHISFSLSFLGEILSRRTF